MLEVIGPGFGRTGTMSCKAALEQLGFGPCYHMIEVYANEGHVDRWTRAINGEPLDVGGLFAGYRAAVDWPACAFWKQLKAENPDAKVVLTRRDPDAWFTSMTDTIFQALRAESDDEQLMRWRVATRTLIFEQTFGNDLSHDHVVRVLHARERRDRIRVCLRALGLRCRRGMGTAVRVPRRPGARNTIPPKQLDRRVPGVDRSRSACVNHPAGGVHTPSTPKSGSAT